MDCALLPRGVGRHPMPFEHSFHVCGTAPARLNILFSVIRSVSRSSSSFVCIAVFSHHGRPRVSRLLHPDRSVVGFQACFYLRCKSAQKDAGTCRACSHAGLAHVHWYTSSSAISVSASRIPRWLTGLCLSEPLLWDIGRERRREFYLVGERD